MPHTPILDPAWRPDGDTIITLLVASLNVFIAAVQIWISLRRGVCVKCTNVKVQLAPFYLAI